MKTSAIWLCLLASIVGCSSNSASDKYGTVPLFCAAWAKAACSPSTVANCTGMAPSDDLTKVTASCIVNQQAFCEGLVPAGYVSTQAQSCLDAVGRSYSDGTLSTKEDAVLGASEAAVVLHLAGNCSHLIKGPSGEGETCSVDSDCDTVDNYVCVLKSGVGKCAIPMAVDNGTSCKAAEAICNPGFYCDGKNCVQSDEAGDTCAHDYECDTGLTCDGVEDSPTSGTCVAPVDQAMCKVDSDCTNNKICLIPTGGKTGRCSGSVITLSSTDQLCENL